MFNNFGDSRWNSTNLEDMRGNKYIVGDMVVKAELLGKSGSLRIGVVTKIDNDKMYLDESKVAIRFPGRMLIVTPLFIKEDNK